MNPLAAAVAVKSRHRGSRVRVPAPVENPVVRCAIYCRISVAENGDRDFDSITAQREACEAFVASQRGEGWTQVGEPFLDNGHTGADVRRPGLQHLLSDIQAGKVDVVVVVRLDRLSRSLLDFLRLMELFEAHHVALAAVRQHLITTSSSGRLMLNILMSMAQFEREQISSRTSDFMCAARRRGKFTGGPPPLGYDLDREHHRLIVNPDEAAMVRELFDWYLQHGSLLKVAQAANDRGWTTKSWVCKDGTRHEGRPLDKTKVSTILRNPTYIGKVRHDGQLLPGEQDGIIDDAVFHRVQAMLDGHGNEGGRLPHGKHPGLLQGLLKCGRCGSTMTHVYTKKKGGRLYRYYMCLTRDKRGKEACPAPYLPAQEIEGLVVQQIRRLARDPALVRAVFEEASKQQQALIPRLQAERQRLIRDRQAKSEQIQRLLAVLAGSATPQPSVTERLAELEGMVGKLNARLTDLDSELTALEDNRIDPNDVARALTQFDDLYNVLYPQERSRVVRSLIATIVYQASGEVQITLKQGGLSAGSLPWNQVLLPPAK